MIILDKDGIRDALGIWLAIDSSEGVPISVANPLSTEPYWAPLLKDVLEWRLKNGYTCWRVRDEASMLKLRLTVYMECHSRG